MRLPRAGLLVTLGCLLPPAAIGAAPPAAVPPAPAPPATAGKAAPAPEDPWAAVDRLIAEQKLELAADRIEALRAAAERRGDEAAWARALVRAAEVRIALGGFETAVRQLREARWPSGLVARTGLELYYAHALRAYAATYSWEIGRRERVATGGQLDLEHWTREQIAAAATASFLEIWRHRAALGAQPVGRLGDVLAANSYPREVRGTLRDAVSYLFVDLLADTSLWTPDETSDLYRLDLPRLLAADPPTLPALPNPPAPAPPALPNGPRNNAARATPLPAPRTAATAGTAPSPPPLAGAATHPLEKLVAVLADLEAWHAAAGRRAAALEARLERSRRLHAAFSAPADRQRIRAALAAQLAKERDLPWWAEGQAVLAAMRRQADDPEALIEARAAALAGERAYPGSRGAQDCRRLVAEIELPGFQVQAMASDGLDRRSIAIDHRNLQRLYFRAWAVDVARRLASGANEPFVDSGKERALLSSGPPAASWAVDLPPTADFRSHRTYAVPPIAAPGAYVVLASAKESFAEERNQVLAVSLVLGDLVLLEEPEAAGPSRLRVLSGTAGEPVPGVEIRLFRHDWQHGSSAVATLITDASGAARFAAPRERSSNFRYLALARRAGELALLEVGQPGEPPRPDGPRALFFSDRSIYRPGQTVRWKVLVYGGDRAAGRLALEAHRTLAVELFDPNRQQVASATVATNDFGTAAGEFVVPAGRPLGSWMLTGTGGGVLGVAQIQVEEYKRPTFEVKLQEPETAPRLNRPAAFRGEARYYFGLPVTSGTVRWRITRRPVYAEWWWEWAAPGVGAGPAEQVVAAGTAAIDADGGFAARFTPEGDERLGKGATFSYRLNAEVTDEGGETGTAERSFRLGLVAVEAAIESEQEFLDPETAAEMTVLRRDLDGVPRPGAGAWRLLRLRQPERPRLPSEEPVAAPALPAGTAAYRTPGDELAPRWQGADRPAATLRRFADGAEVARGELAHDARGRAAVKLPPLAPGAYRLRYDTRDDFGATATAQREFLVTGEAPLAAAAWLEVQRSSARVGETVAALVHSGFPGQPLELAIRHGRGVEWRSLVARAAPLRIELPVREEDRGGIALRLVAVRDHQLLHQEAAVAVPWDDHELKIEYQTFRDLLRPGARETWRLKVTGNSAGGAVPAAAELLAYMYDRSLDAYAPHLPARPLDLWPHTRPFGWPSANLAARSAGWCMGEHFGDLPSGAGLVGDLSRELARWGIGGPGQRPRPQSFRGAAPVAGSPMWVGTESSLTVTAGRARDSITVTAEAPLLDEKRINVGGNEAAAAAPPSPPPALRADFSETAFWQPHLLSGADGTAAIEFTVPDSVTSWNVWVHALTRDFRSGADHREARSVKDLLVRPYLPRFLREGDRAELRVVLNDAAPRALDGFVTLEILDPDRPDRPDADAALLGEFGMAPAAARQPFHVEAGKSASVTFPLAVPRRVGQVAFKVVATAGDTSDGELRPLPLLPSRVHLAQSRFVALHGRDRRTMSFTDRQRTDDPSRLDEQLVVTLDAQLFYSVLAAVPYLVDYPYECTEQTLNRFLSTAILGSLFSRYPAVGRMAEQLARRDTELEAFGAPDANRRMALEETPWLLESEGNDRRGERPLIKVLDPRIAAAQRASALAKLERDQLPSGAFPWWPAGPPSDYMTLYLLYGFAKAGEFGVAVPREVVERGWRYLGDKYQREFQRKLDQPDCDCAWEFLTFLNYVASAYPDPSWLGGALPVAERRRILDASFRHWREHSPYLKGLLALTLRRMGRPEDARLVFDSVMDSARTTPDEGTFWQPEARAWLWYDDTIETHAFALRALMELRPEDPHLDGLVQWLFLNKKLNHWKSTRATAEVVYSLAKYLDSHHQLAVREAARVEVAGGASELVFEPDRYTGKQAQIVVPGGKLGPGEATVTVTKETPGLLFASATWQFSTEELPKEARGDLFAVERRYFRRLPRGKEMVLEPLLTGAVLAPGDEIEVQLSLRSRAPAEYVHLRDPRPAGFEPGVALSGWRWDTGLARYEEVRDSGSNFFFEWLPAGEYTLRYRVRAALAGTFRAGPATMQSMYAPEFTAYSAGDTVRVAAPPP